MGAAHAVDLARSRASPSPRAAPRRGSRRSAGRSAAQEVEPLRRAAAHDRAGDGRLAHQASVGRVDVAQALLGQPLAHVVDVEPELAGAPAVRAWSASFACALPRLREDVGRAPSRRTTTTPSSSATITSPGRTSAPAQTIGVCTLAGRLLDRALRARSPRDQTGNPISVSSATSRTPASMTRPRTPCATRLVGQQVAEVAVVAGAGRRHDQDVAGAGLLDGDMDHPVVAGRDLAGERVAGDPGRPVDRAQLTGRAGPCGPAPRAPWPRRGAASWSTIDEVGASGTGDDDSQRSP